MTARRKDNMVTADRPADERAEVQEHLTSYKRDHAQLSRRREELLDAYPNQWVAIHDGHVFHAAELDALFAELRLKGVEPGRVPREFLTRDQPALLL